MTLPRSFSIICLLAFLCLVLGGCSLPTTSGKETSKPTVKKGSLVVLLLPADGPFAPIAQKIRRGAETAATELNKNGTEVRFLTIDSSNPSWEIHLNAAIDSRPESFFVIGGPLQSSVYAKARESGILRRHAFFTFMPQLDDGEEGKLAWRFFPSPQDQIDALLSFATDTMGVSTFGAFYPGDVYGLRMTGLMEQALAKRGLSLQKASYDAGNPNSWASAVAPLIKPTQNQDGSNAVPIPQTSFEALFLPDSWRNMGMLTTALTYNGEDRLILMGTTLWEQGLSGKRLPDVEKFALAVFPGAWNQARAPKALQGAGHDFWTALGYDFVRFAVQLGFDKLSPSPDRAPSEVINAACARVRMIWGMAPISWDGNGIAHQKLYLFQPAADGMKPLAPEDYKATRQAILQRAALRQQGLPSVDAQGNPLVPGAQPGVQPGQPIPLDASGQPIAQPAAAQPGVQPATQPVAGQPAQQPAIGTTPIPSYKLRLPGSGK